MLIFEDSKRISWEQLFEHILIKWDETEME